MDGVERLLAAIETSVEGFEVVETQAGGRLERQGRAAALVLFVLSGRGVLSARDGEEVELVQNALVVLPRGDAVCVRARLSAAASPAAPDLVLAIGAVRATVAGAADLFVVLDAPIAHHFSESAVRENFLMLADEAQAPALGSRALADAVYRQALILLVRHRHNGSGAACPWLVATRDPRLLPALSAMLDRSSDPITLDDLAALTGMSRSVFADRFAEAFGASPMEFLRRIRLGRAARLLATTDIPVKKIAHVVGYESRSYFSRAFRARYDVDPTDYRTRGPAREPSAISCS
jgi:AraC family transcriptional activator of mtrCDE